MLVHGPENVNATTDNSALFKAIANNNIEEVKRLINAGINIEAAVEDEDEDEDYCALTPLTYSIEMQRTEIIKILINANVNLTAEDQEGVTPLEFAIVEGHINEAKLLIDNGALRKDNVNIYETIMHGIRTHQTEIVEYIFAHEDIDFEKDLNGHFDLRFNGLKEEENYSGLTILVMAILHESPKVVELLVTQYKVNTNTTCTIEGVTYSPLSLATNNGIISSELDLKTIKRNLDIVKILAKNGASLEVKNSNGLTPLQVAMEQGAYDFAYVFIENGAAIPSNISTIEMAIAKGDVSFFTKNKNNDLSNSIVPLLQRILCYLINSNENELADACIAIFGILIESSENSEKLHVCDKDWEKIVDSNNIALVELLVEFLLKEKISIHTLYPDINKTRWIKHAAVNRKHFDIAELLLSALGKQDLKYTGMTLLHYAILKFNSDITTLLIENNADKEALFQEMTALRFAIHHYINTDQQPHRLEIIQKLINAKANIGVVCLGETPLQYAFKNGSYDICKMLIYAGADLEELKDDIHFAIWANNSKVPTLLLNKNNLEKLYLNATPLHFAIMLANYSCFTFLMAAGANIEAKYMDMTALHHAISRNQLSMVQLLILAKANKEALYNNCTPLHSAILHQHTEIANFIYDSLDNKAVPVEIARSIEDRVLLSKVIPYCTLFDIPITDLVDSNHFNTHEKRVEFVTNPQKYLFKYKLVTPKILHALSLFILHQHVMRHEASTRENIDSDSKVICANTHFKHKVQPHFAEYFSSTEAHETMLKNIFSDIRALIIDYIVKDAKESENHSLLTFIAQNKQALINGSDEALKASCEHFTLLNPAHAAFRGLNPYAPVKDVNNWPNLLTAPLENKQIWTTEADNQSKERGLQEAYEILKERLAYYYLAVVDPNDGDKQTRDSRIENFISLLADIRNAHGLDDPSCYPGTITRIAMMGAFHQIAQLPPTTKERIEDYLKEVILDKFTKEMQSASSYEDKEALYLAITVLNIDSAKGIIKHPERYQDNWGSLRQNFLKNIGDADVHLNTIFERDLFTVVKDDVTFFRFYLCNMGIGKIGEALASAFNRYTDSVPTITDIGNLNSFDDNKSKEYELFDLLKNVLLDVKPECKTSLRNLRLFKETLSNNVTLIFKGKPIGTVLESFELEDATQDKLNDTIKQILCDKKWKMPVINPFDDKIEKMNSLISKPTTTPQFSAYTTNRDSLLKKQVKFNSYLDIIEKELQNVWFDNEVVAEVIESLVQSSNNVNLDQDTFLNSLDEKPKAFLEQFPELLEKLGIKAASQKLRN